MIVYHGSTEIIENPDVVHSKKYLDFGRGFYITTFENQAKKWAVRKGMRQEKAAIVNVYELSEAWDDFKVLSFEKENEKWLDFVCACRKGQPLNKEYDIIIGNVADDDVFKTVDMYFRGLWNKEKVLGELRYYKMNNQICIVNQETLVDKKQLEEVYKQNLENDIINAISEMKGIDLRKAFDLYYSSKLAEQISNDSYGIENMDAKYLAEDLIEN